MKVNLGGGVQWVKYTSWCRGTEAEEGSGKWGTMRSWQSRLLWAEAILEEQLKESLKSWQWKGSQEHRRYFDKGEKQQNRKWGRRTTEMEARRVSMETGTRENQPETEKAAGRKGFIWREKPLKAGRDRSWWPWSSSDSALSPLWRPQAAQQSPRRRAKTTRRSEDHGRTDGVIPWNQIREAISQQACVVTDAYWWFLKWVFLGRGLQYKPDVCYSGGLQVRSRDETLRVTLWPLPYLQAQPALDLIPTVEGQMRKIHNHYVLARKRQLMNWMTYQMQGLNMHSLYETALKNSREWNPVLMRTKDQLLWIFHCWW